MLFKNYYRNYQKSDLLPTRVIPRRTLRSLLSTEKGADINAKANDGSTALMWASRDGYTDVAEVLIQNGADVNQKNNKGQNVMMVAYGNRTQKAIMDAVKKRNEKENGGSFFSKIKRRLGIDM